GWSIGMTGRRREGAGAQSPPPDPIAVLADDFCQWPSLGGRIGLKNCLETGNFAQDARRPFVYAREFRRVATFADAAVDWGPDRGLCPAICAFALCAFRPAAIRRAKQRWTRERKSLAAPHVSIPALGSLAVASAFQLSRALLFP